MVLGGLLLVTLSCPLWAQEPAAETPAMPPKVNGVHSPAHNILGTALSSDRTKILFYDNVALSLWDVRTGALIKALYFEYSSMPEITRGHMVSIDVHLKHFYVNLWPSEVCLMLDIESGKSRVVPYKLKRITHTGKGIDQNDKGVDLATGKPAALTDIDLAQPCYDGVHYFYSKGKKTFLYNATTQKTRALEKNEKAPGVSPAESYLPIAGHVAFHPTNSPVIFVQDQQKKEVNRIALLHPVESIYPHRFMAPDQPAVIMIEGNSFTKFYKGLQAHQSFMTAYRIPDGEVLYSTPLHRPLSESHAFFDDVIENTKRSLQYYIAEQNMQAAKNGGRSSSGGQTASAATTGVRVGDRQADGIVFYVDGSGQHGLVLSLTESFAPERYPSHPESAKSLDASGVSPWYIPSLDEWSLIRTTKGQLAAALKREGGKPLGDDAIYYWTSTSVGYGGNRVANRWGYNPDNNERSEMYTATHLCTTRLIRVF